MRLFEWRGRGDGRDLEDWFNAEMEFVKPVPVEIVEKGDVLHIRAEVPGFTEEELQVNLEPGAFTLKGEHREETEKKEEKDVSQRKARPADFPPSCVAVSCNP